MNKSRGKWILEMKTIQMFTLEVNVPTVLFTIILNKTGREMKN